MHRERSRSVHLPSCLGPAETQRISQSCHPYCPCSAFLKPSIGADTPRVYTANLPPTVLPLPPSPPPLSLQPSGTVGAYHVRREAPEPRRGRRVCRLRLRTASRSGCCWPDGRPSHSCRWRVVAAAPEGGRRVWGGGRSGPRQRPSPRPPVHGGRGGGGGGRVTPPARGEAGEKDQWRPRWG